MYRMTTKYIKLKFSYGTGFRFPSLYEEFYVYAGAVNKLPCTVKDYVFSDFNQDQIEKVIAANNSSFSEIWWFYPSATVTNGIINQDIDKYVVYNYQEQVWYYGTLSRTCWLDRGVESFPVAASTDHALYYQELGNDDGSYAPSAGINAYIESSQIDIGDGDQFAFIKRMIPDITFRDSTNETPQATMTLKARNFPGGAYLQSNSKVVEKTASVPVEQFTNQVHLRLRRRRSV